MVEGYGEIGDNFSKVKEGRTNEQFQGHVAELVESDLGLAIIKHSEKCSVCRNLQIMMGDIILNHIKEFDNMEIK